ncbi:MAG TPA: hypothetical protein IAC72_05440 [Candidatus Fimimonas merdipullorum]|uniref:Zinc ribbon domain-containing protein n=1 Tax=Candidatus Fimimonas merdipullorum TaxID=2840822 RepID=A0A9D1MYB5_9BACT|nr:hypothetical protein [Candidatus Fimimonas merdipullorum]
MQQIDKEIRKRQILAFTLTFMFVFGIPAIIFGASYGGRAAEAAEAAGKEGGGTGWWILMAAGIVCTAVGFFGMPLAWVNYGETRGYRRIVAAVVNENLHTVQEIAVQLSLSEKEVRNKLDVCFQKGYFVGIKRNGDSLILNENRPMGKKEYSTQCPNCGAKFIYTADNAVCPYCGSPVQKQ